MTYEEFIQNILETRGRFACGDEYHERHHIVPKCMDGNNEEDNLIDLFAIEHFEAHRLLVLENPDNEKLTYALWCMCSLSGSSKKREDVTAIEYEEARIRFAKTMSKRMSGSNNPNFGKSYNKGFRHSPESKDKIRIAAIKRFENFDERKLYSDMAKERFQNPENCPMFGKHHNEETRARLSELKQGVYVGEKNPMYGRPWWDEDTPQEKIDEWKRHLSEANRGENNPCYGKHPSKETIEKRVVAFKATMSTDEMKKKLSENNSGANNPMAVQINQYDKDEKFIKTFDCIKYAADELNICVQNIGRSAKTHGRRSAGGFLWYYAKDPTQPDKTKIIQK